MQAAVVEKFGGGPVGVENLAAAIGEERDTIEDVIEPFLIQQGFIARTARGRIATRLAWQHFGLKMPENPSEFFTRMRAIAEHMGTTNLAALALGLGSLTLIIFVPKLFPRVPGSNYEIKTPVDSFIAAKLSEKDLKAAPPADRATLIRRATYDLTGLPPTIAELDSFTNDHSTNAFGRVLERLLASPRYGEQWGRHWLDVVRYADTAGENTDHPLPQAWRYRNWVINAFNTDKPYDEFLQEQLAGDLLPAKTDDEKCPFCVQSLKNSPVISHYRAYFSDCWSTNSCTEDTRSRLCSAQRWRSIGPPLRRHRVTSLRRC
jgi:hypothetical protein